MTSKEIANALLVLRPGAEWILKGNDYTKIDWVDKVQTAPTLQEVTDQIAASATTDAAQASRLSDLSSDSGAALLLNQAKTATVAQIDNWLLANVTNLAQARSVLAAIIKVLAIRMS